MPRFALAFLLSVILTSSSAQPIISYYLGSDSEVSKGRSFKFIEENSEILIRGISNVPHRVEKKFNSHGNIISNTAFNSAGGRTSETKWEYINGKHLAHKNHKYFANIIGWREDVVDINYNMDIMLPEKITLYKEGNVFQWALLTHDTLGRVDICKVYSSSGAHTFTEKLLYIENNNLIRVMVQRANGQFYGSWSYPIDPSKEFRYESVSRTYYPNGYLMIETLTSAIKGDQAYYYEYKYDSQRNWVVKETFQVNLGKKNRIRKKKIEHRVTRNITYY